MGKQLCKWAFGLAILVGFAAPTDAAENVCDDADHCVWIMENHGPHEFDYQVLTEELQAFGPAGKDYLIMLVADKDQTVAGRAIEILTRGSFQFTHQEARDIGRAWPSSNVKKMSALMVKVGSPDVQAIMIGSLLDQDETVRREARSVLSQMRENKKIYQIREFEYAPIAKAVVEEPTRELVQMLAAFPDDKTHPILKRVLQTSDTPSIIAAYGALYNADPDMALQTLLATVRRLEDDQIETAFALAGLLQHRHKKRADSFYMELAKKLAEDPEMSPMGNVVGLEAIINRYFKNAQAQIKINTNATVLQALSKVLLAQGENGSRYEQNFALVTQDEANVWADMLLMNLMKNPTPATHRYHNLVSNIWALPKESREPLLAKAMSNQSLVPLIENVLGHIMMKGDKSHLPLIHHYLDHWSDPIRQTAKMAKENIERDYDFEKRFERRQAVIGAKIKFAQGTTCKVTKRALNDYEAQLPFFEMEETDQYSIFKRRMVSTTYPVKDGWLVGYAAGEWGGGLWFFGNTDGVGKNLSYVLPRTEMNGALSHLNAQYILPVRIPKLGQYTDEFWVILDDGGFTSDSFLYRLKYESGGVRTEFVRHLAERGFRAFHGDNNTYVLSHDNHSDLVLSQNGSIQRACN